jgi:hypothetical protein
LKEAEPGLPGVSRELVEGESPLGDLATDTSDRDLGSDP